MRDGCLEGAAITSRFPVASPLPVFAFRSSDARRGVGPSSRSAYRTAPTGASRTPTGLPRSARTSCDRGGCPLYPEDGGALPGRGTCSAGACRSTAASPDHPAAASHRQGSASRGINEGSRDSPVRSSPACGRPGGTGRPWASPRASHPAVTGDARRGWDRPSSTDLELHAHITLILQSGSSLVACDLASHRPTQASGATVRTRSQTGRKRECSNRREAAQSSPPLPAFASGLASERKRLTRRPCRRGRSSAPGRVKTIARSRAHDQASPVPT
jgi:hypothetical protein